MGESASNGPVPDWVTLLPPREPALDAIGRQLDPDGTDPPAPDAFGVIVDQERRAWWKYALSVIANGVTLLGMTPLVVSVLEGGHGSLAGDWCLLFFSAITFLSLLYVTVVGLFNRRVFVFEPKRIRYRRYLFVCLDQRTMSRNDFAGIEYEAGKPWGKKKVRFYKAFARFTDGSRMLLAPKNARIKELGYLVDLICRWADLAPPELPEGAENAANLAKDGR